MMYNINADPNALKKYEIDKLSSQMIDMVRFSQMIAKIAHVSTLNHIREIKFSPLVSKFIRTDFEAKKAYNSHHFKNVGCLWNQKEKQSSYLHEIEIGKMKWNTSNYIATRVRLFACYGMPSYYVTIGSL